MADNMTSHELDALAIDYSVSISEVGPVGEIPKNETFPKLEDFTAVASGRACFNPISPGYVLAVANKWKEVMRANGFIDQREYDQLINIGIQGFMTRSEGRGPVSKAIAKPLFEIHEYRDRLGKANT